MKIAYLVTDPGIPVFGDKGASVHVRSITSALCSLGHTVKIFASNLEGDNPGENNIPCSLVGDRKKARKRWKWIKKTAAGPYGEKDHPETQIDEIIKMDIAGRAVDDVVKLLQHEPVDLIIERLSPFGGAGMLISDKLGINRIVEMNAPLTEEFRLWRRMELDSISSRIESAVLLSAQGVIAVSHVLKHKLLDLSVDPDKILVIPNGFDPGLFFPASKDQTLNAGLGIENKFVIGFIGSLKPWHGLDVLFNAFAQLSLKTDDTALLVIGEGPEQSALQALAAELKITDKVLFVGKVPHGSVPSYIRLLDIAVAPYNVKSEFYFSPLKLIEYMACGVPVIACGRGEISRLMQDRELGIHLPQADPESLTQALLSLYTDPARRIAVAASAREAIQDRTWSNIAQQTILFAEKLHLKENE